MKSRIPLSILVGLGALVIGFLWLHLPVNNQENRALLPAAVNRDCAPWDGAAFTISIPYDAISRIELSIWRSPDIEAPASFSFPDRSGRTGSALLNGPSGSTEPLTGRISLRPVEDGTALAGEFDLTADGGRIFRGRFHAVWGNRVALCG